ncbi:hypothetical protein BIZ78_gp143 [Erwinia phage vB_EamM_Caitlin]|uniref:hypothetical protein n=1 Tax=Erwinia phage vB_EamM_Caitlin TaxID=1883379 RepID=UPI00081C6823|nr:hypothetical protein BIZ78_gp143 [Erwinia phage vB_EamM_Caitlin]ANZ48432.1 hypothetical protein CAITLIN_137 [Erwinia phage vB_EamM_Caitlin]
MIKNLLKHIFQPQKVIEDTDIKLRLETAIAHIDTLETLANKHMDVLSGLVERMVVSPDPEVRKLAQNISPGIRGFRNSLVELKAFRIIFKTDKM